MQTHQTKHFRVLALPTGELSDAEARQYLPSSAPTLLPFPRFLIRVFTIHQDIPRAWPCAPLACMLSHGGQRITGDAAFVLSTATFCRLSCRGQIRRSDTLSAICTEYDQLAKPSICGSSKHRDVAIVGNG